MNLNKYIEAIPNQSFAEGSILVSLRPGGDRKEDGGDLKMP